MAIEASAPSKTFLLGEYAVIKGGPALILTTLPRFKLLAEKAPAQSGQIAVGISPSSPAGKLIQSDPVFFQHWQIQFLDPYQQLGGLGASSAQFLMLYALRAHVRTLSINQADLLKTYQQCAWDQQGLAPSGADVMAQWQGGITYYDPTKPALEVLSWPFADLSYALVHTGNKLATHEHLKSSVGFDEKTLSPIVVQAYDAIISGHLDGFLQAVNDYARALKAQGLLTEQSKRLLGLLRQNSDVRAIKGCGALGADVILLLFAKAKQELVVEWLKTHDYHVVAIGQTLAEGLHIRTL